MPQVELALEAMFAAVKARFDAETPDVENYFGWLEPPRQYDHRRIVWVPGDPAGSAGPLGPPKFPGSNPRSLGTLTELFTCVITARDATAPADELAQWRACRLLFDAWWRALWLAAYQAGAGGQLSVVSTAWVKQSPKQRTAGASIRAVCNILSRIPDAALQGVPIGTDAVIDATLLDLTEQETYTREP